MELVTHQFLPDPTKFVAPSWQELADLAFVVAQQIRQDHSHFDRLVTLAKGGWPMSCSLVDLLGISQVASIGVKFYAGINQRLTQPQIYQDLPVSVEGEKILLYDDVADTGESLKFVTDHLLHQEKVASVTTATLFYKPRSVVIPHYFGSTTDAWIIFPYDNAETIKELGQKWLAAGITQSEIQNRLARLNINPKVFAAYWP